MRWTIGFNTTRTTNVEFNVAYLRLVVEHIIQQTFLVNHISAKYVLYAQYCAYPTDFSCQSLKCKIYAVCTVLCLLLRVTNRGTLNSTVVGSVQHGKTAEQTSVHTNKKGMMKFWYIKKFCSTLNKPDQTEFRMSRLKRLQTYHWYDSSHVTLFLRYN